MGSRDKLGLLLGLIAIILIVYIIRGLPISSAQNNNVLAVNNQGASVVIPEADLMNDARQAVAIIKNSKPDVQLRQAPDVEQVRNVVNIPNSIPANIGRAKVNADGSYVHIVRSGETLADIAKKAYGSQEGNRYANIEKIFKANKDQLKSPDRVYEGQKLVIPPLSCLAKSDNKTVAQTLIHKVKGFNFGVATLSSKTRQQKRYQVREGDTLWKIAAKQLGNGSKYKDILRLNRSKLKAEDDLQVGMVLNMPES